MTAQVMTNPFEDDQVSYLILMNGEGQHSLWPAFAEVPVGWTRVFGPNGRQECLDDVNRNWADMRPRSLIEAMEGFARFADVRRQE
jgi:MbtH protein